MMYTRGQLAVIGKVGRKALRLYHEEGLLVPASVNAENGYHYYDESQLAVLEKIKRLRKIGLSLYEIKQVLDGKVPEKELVSGRLREMDSRLQELKELTALDEGTGSETKDGGPDISVFKSCRCLYVDENIERENLGISVGKLYEKASRAGIAAAGNHFVVYEGLLTEGLSDEGTSDDGLSDRNAFSMRTCLPVKDYKGPDSIEVPEVKCLHCNFTGGFSKVGNAHLRIQAYAAAHKISFAGTVYEVYNTDMSVDVYYALTGTGC